MVDYAIGDIQGCYDPLQRLLAEIDFDDRRDRLWLVGDLVNRGPQSLEVLRFIKALPIQPIITLGNHDLHLLATLFTDKPWRGHDDTLLPILRADDALELGHWLRKQRLLYHDEVLNLVMIHAGLAPIWDLKQAKALAAELEAVLAGDGYLDYLNEMYGNQPACWRDDLQGMARWRAITNFMTRMRFCDAAGCLNLDYKGTVKDAPAQLYPWYVVPNRRAIQQDILFGHWAALQGQCPVPGIYALDTGCLWGGRLTALRLQDRTPFSVPGMPDVGKVGQFD